MQIDPQNLTTVQRLQLMQQAELHLRANPGDFEANSTLGILLFHEKRLASAAEYLTKALKINKKDLKARRALGDVYYHLKDFEKCRIVRRKTMEIYPRNVELTMDYGAALQAMGRIDQAIEMFTKAEKMKPDHPKVMLAKGKSLRSAGKYEEANAIFSRIQEISPGHSESLYLFCNSRKFARNEAETYDTYIKNALEMAKDAMENSQLNYAGGKIWQDCHEYEKAFTYFKCANERRMDELNLDFTAPFENLKSVFNRQYFNSAVYKGDESGRYIFVLGMPRSGTTLTESILGAHSKITAGDEMSFIQGINKNNGLESIYDGAFKRNMTKYSEADFQRMADHYKNSTAMIGPNTPHITDKLPHNFMAVGLIRLLFPNSKIIHCRRHPIDNCVSLYTNSMQSFHIAYKSDLSTLGLYYRQYWQLMQFWRDNVPGGMHEIYYEDVVANTEYCARGMIDYLGLEWETDVMQREGSQKSIKTLSAWQARQPVYKSSVEKWRHYEKHLGPLIDALGPIVGEYERELMALNTKEQAG